MIPSSNQGGSSLHGADDVGTHVNNVVHWSKLTTSERCNYKIKLYNFKIPIFIDISDNLIDILLLLFQLYVWKILSITEIIHMNVDGMKV